MATLDEIHRIATAMNALRPDWRLSSLVTLLTNHHAHRAYADLAVAATVVATDRTTRTPQLLNEHGRWWEAAQAGSGVGRESTPMPPRLTERCPDHFGPAHNCPGCRADELAAGYTGPSDPKETR